MKLHMWLQRVSYSHDKWVWLTKAGLCNDSLVGVALQATEILIIPSDYNAHDD